MVIGSTQFGRAEAQPDEVPSAIAYYRELERRAESPSRPRRRKGKGPVKFNFDWSFNSYPLAYDATRAGDAIYRLSGGKCG